MSGFLIWETVLRQEIVGLWAGHLVFVKWNKIQAFFSPRHSKDKASGKSWALLKQRDKGPVPEVREDFPICTQEERPLGGQKGSGPHPIRSVDMHPQASAVGSILAKSCVCILGRIHGPVRCEERNKIIGQRETKAQKGCPVWVIYVASVLLLTQDAPTPLGLWSA